MNVYENLEKLGIKLLRPTEKAGIYKRTIGFGDKLVYVSGTGPACSLGPTKLGRLGRDLTLEDGQEEARRCIINILSNLHEEIGDLNRIKRFVKMLAFIASDDDFTQQPLVANGASALIRDVFGDDVGVPTRSAIGVNVLPGNIPVEIELLLELKD